MFKIKQLGKLKIPSFHFPPLALPFISSMKFNLRMEPIEAVMKN
jgi:hypothetical protein